MSATADRTKPGPSPRHHARGRAPAVRPGPQPAEPDFAVSQGFRALRRPRPGDAEAEHPGTRQGRPLPRHDFAVKATAPAGSRGRPERIRRVVGWMRRAPLRVVMVACLVAAGLLLVGSVAHITDLLRHGLHPYPWAPDWLNLYWSSLAVLDPLAALLLIGGKRRGVDLACGIMVTDVAANWYAAYGIQHTGFLAQPGLQRLTAFALLVLATTPLLRGHLADRAHRRTAD